MVLPRLSVSNDSSFFRVDERGKFHGKRVFLIYLSTSNCLIFMKQRQEDFLSMVKVVKTFFTANSVKVGTLPALVTVDGALQVALDDVSVFYVRQQKKTEGATIDKEVAREAASVLGILVAGNIEAYAMDIGNNTLRKDFHFTASIFNKLPDTEMVDTLNEIHATAVVLLPSMGNYGNTVGSLLDFRTAIDAYVTEVTRPRDILVTKETATGKILEALGRIRALLRKADTLMRNFRLSDSVFYADYLNSRKVVNTGHSFTRLGLFIELEDGVDASGIPVTITKGTRVYTEVTDVDGLANFASVVVGEFTVEVNHPGYVPFVQNHVRVRSGRSTELRIVLRKEV